MRNFLDISSIGKNVSNQRLVILKSIDKILKKFLILLKYIIKYYPNIQITNNKLHNHNKNEYNSYPNRPPWFLVTTNLNKKTLILKTTFNDELVSRMVNKYYHYSFDVILINVISYLFNLNIKQELFTWLSSLNDDKAYACCFMQFPYTIYLVV